MVSHLYLVIDIATILVPFLFSFHPRLAFYRQWRYAWKAIMLAAIPFILWDIWFTRIGAWGFTPAYLSGIYFFNIPLEEVLFFICIPYSCLFTYYCLSVLVKKDWFHGIEKWITGSLVAFLAIMAALHPAQLYTSITLGLLAILLGISAWLIKAKWLSRFYFAYLVLLIPFSIVNGILTGSGLTRPVVWYNNAENLGIRLGTIPFEDIFYGMLLILLNVFFYEYFRRKNGP